MMDGFPWTVLGIAPTRDPRAIRAAYSARLKAIDPEADPRGFIALREAFEAAKRGETEPEASDAPLTPGDPLDPVAAHVMAMSRILDGHAGPQPWLAPAEQEALLAHWQALIAEPAMDGVEAFSDAANGMAELIARTLPLSEALVVPATGYFGWEGKDDTLDQMPAPATVARHRRLHLYLDEVRTPGDRRHHGWTELTKPAPPGALRGDVDAVMVRDLLTVVRHARPVLEQQFDAARVAMWDLHLKPPRSSPIRGGEADAASFGAQGCRHYAVQMLILLAMGLVVGLILVMLQ